MTPRIARTLILIAATALIGVALAALWWPRGEPSSDLVSTTPIATSTTSTTTTAPVATTVPTTTTTTTLPSIPGRIRVPSVGLDAPVVPVGLNPDGSMEVPKASEVGWYEPGVRPGSPAGSAVLAAHVDYAGEKGAFFNLRSIPEGAEVFVVGPDGRELRFVVNQRLQVDKKALPVQELFRSDGAPTLTLITCGGAFDRGARHYRDNIVVRAALQA